MKIFYQKKKINNKVNIYLELSKNINKQNEESFENKSLTPLIEYNNSDSNEVSCGINNINMNKPISDINENLNDKDESSEHLKKLHFFDFLLNNIYFEFLFKKNNPQQIINMCNEIISNYASIDSIIYNQILFENLLKDYKWNNPELKNLDYNNFILELKTLAKLNT